MTAGLLFHCHHDILAEWTDNAEERFECVEQRKPKDEVELRFALFTLVRIEEFPPEWDKARAEWDKACAEYDRAYAEWDKACAELAKARAELAKACAEWDKARAEWDKARAEWAIRNHKKYCHPNCPWDGETIFAKGNGFAALAKEQP